MIGSSIDNVILSCRIQNVLFHIHIVKWIHQFHIYTLITYRFFHFRLSKANNSIEYAFQCTETFKYMAEYPIVKNRRETHAMLISFLFICCSKTTLFYYWIDPQVVEPTEVRNRSTDLVMHFTLVPSIFGWVKIWPCLWGENIQISIHSIE